MNRPESEIQEENIIPQPTLESRSLLRQALHQIVNSREFRALLIIAATATPLGFLTPETQASDGPSSRLSVAGQVTDRLAPTAIPSRTNLPVVIATPRAEATPIRSGVGLPDLIVSNLDTNPSLSGSTSPSSSKDLYNHFGEVATFKGVIINSGANTSAVTTAIIRYDENVDGIWDITATVPVNSLAPGSSQSITFPNLLTPRLGVNRFQICADSGNTVSESREDNNCATRDIYSINVDIVMTNLSVAPLFGNYLRFQADFQDNAGGGVYGSVIDAYNTVTFRGPGSIVSTHPANIPHNVLPGGVRSGGSWPVLYDFAPSVPGNWTYRFCADTGDHILETNEGNNCSLETSFTITR